MTPGTENSNLYMNINKKIYTKSYRVIDFQKIVFLHPIYKNSITFVYGMNNGLWSSRTLSDICHNDLLMAVHNKNNLHVSIFDLFVALYFEKVMYCRMDDTQITYHVNILLRFYDISFKLR